MPDTFNGPDCLATAKDAGDCAVALSTATAPSDGYFLAEAAQSSSVFTVNLNPAFCPGAPVCAPVVDGQVVWRDDHHLTSGYAARRRDEIWQLIQQTGVLSLPGDRWVAGASHGHCGSTVGSSSIARQDVSSSVYASRTVFESGIAQHGDRNARCQPPRYVQRNAGAPA